MCYNLSDFEFAFCLFNALCAAISSISLWFSSTSIYPEHGIYTLYLIVLAAVALVLSIGGCIPALYDVKCLCWCYTILMFGVVIGNIYMLGSYEYAENRIAILDNWAKIIYRPNRDAFYDKTYEFKDKYNKKFVGCCGLYGRMDFDIRGMDIPKQCKGTQPGNFWLAGCKQLIEMHFEKQGMYNYAVLSMNALFTFIPLLLSIVLIYRNIVKC